MKYVIIYFAGIWLCAFSLFTLLIIKAFYTPLTTVGYIFLSILGIALISSLILITKVALQKKGGNDGK